MKINKTMIPINLMLFSACGLAVAESAGLHPVNKDGFETGDWRNFKPHYIGDATEWIRPQFQINDTDPISGNYSLQWRGAEQEHEWVKVSDAFTLELPAEASIDVRVRANDSDWSIRLLLMESYTRYTGVGISPDENGQLTASLQDLTKASSPMEAATEQLYRLTVRRAGPEEVTAKVTDLVTGEMLVKLSGLSGVIPEALGIYVYTAAGSDAVLDFDNVTVDAAPYRMKSGEFTRSPQYVMLPQFGDVSQEDGNWVGAQSTMKKNGQYLMWYRIRSNEGRGNGYGFAESEDGVNWKKYEGNPVFTYDDEHFSSMEKISVLYVDGLYRAWYTKDPRGGFWSTYHATSKDGKTWDDHGVVVNDTYAKDPVVMYVEGKYYLYSIRDNVNVGIYTSTDGFEWEHRNTIPMGVHRHIAATYVDRTEEFHLYTTGGFAGVSRAVSRDGVNFGPFTQVWQAPKVGLGDWADAGVTYMSFLTDEHGKISDDRELPFYYQARNSWGHNHPSWNYHGSERVVLAGRYEGLYPSIITTVQPDGTYVYHGFPFEIPRAEGLDIHASREVLLRIGSWQPDANEVGGGELEVKKAGSGHSGPVNTQLQWHIRHLQPNSVYELELDGDIAGKQRADDQGTVLFTVIANGDHSANLPFTVRRSN